MEWLSELFVEDAQPPQFLPDKNKAEYSKKGTIKQRRDDLSGVIRELDPDVVIIVEGPCRPEELQLFFDNIGQGTWKTELQVSPDLPPDPQDPTQTPKKSTQNIGIAVRVDTGKFKQTPIQRFDDEAKKCFGEFLIDTDNDDIEERYRFERLPLYVEIEPAEGSPFRVLGLHLKSKGIHGAYEWSKWWAVAESNRRKIIAEATHIHGTFINPYLSDVQKKQIPLIVCGDINDGPGLDACEKRLFGSGIERLMGTIWQPDFCLGNALFDSLGPKAKEKLNFSSIYTTRYSDPIFNNTYQEDWIDHILYSKCQIANWTRNAQIHHTMPAGENIWEKYKHASDHHPVSVEVVT